MVTSTVCVQAATYTVDFEDGTKAAYAPGNVTLGGLEWNMNNALIGNLTADKFNGTKSCRGRHPFTNTMNQAKSGGIGTLSLVYARYGTDADAPTMVVEYSTDSGSSWTQAGDAFSAVGIDTLTTFSTTVNQAGDLLVRIISTNGVVGRRANIDDIVMTDFGEALDPVINVTPSGAFGTLVTNFTTNIVFTISNNGAASNLVIETPLSVNGAGFSITAQPGLSTIPPAGSTTFEVEFAPVAVTSYVGSIQISNNSAAAVQTVNLSGTGASGYAPPPAGYWYEPFDYDAGDLTNVTANWTIFSGTTGLDVEPGTLIYTDYPVTGGKLAYGAGTADARRDFTASNVAYASFLIQADKLPTTTSDYCVSFNPTAYATRFFLSGEAANGSFLCGISSAAGNLTWTGSEFATGVVHRIVLKFDGISSNFNLWVNPTGTETTPDVSVSPAGAATAFSFAIRQGTFFQNGGAELYLDEIIVGDSWNAVQIPEPGLLAGFGLLLAAGLRRRC